MKRPILLAAAALVVVFATGGEPRPAFAHHCFDSEYDAAAPAAVMGKVLAVRWVNPHTQIVVQGSNAGGPVRTYEFSGGTPNSLLRGGLTRELLKEGVEVEVLGWLSKDKTCPFCEAAGAAACQANARMLSLAGGPTYFVGSTGTSAPVDQFEPTVQPRGPADW